jgi:hypothetical protein
MRAAEYRDLDNFDEIEQAVQETRRGRWFLEEYARRIRQGETARILKAVETLEGVLKAVSPEMPEAPYLKARIKALQSLAKHADALVNVRLPALLAAIEADQGAVTAATDALRRSLAEGGDIDPGARAALLTLIEALEAAHARSAAGGMLSNVPKLIQQVREAADDIAAMLQHIPASDAPPPIRKGAEAPASAQTRPFDFSFWADNFIFNENAH